VLTATAAAAAAAAVEATKVLEFHVGIACCCVARLSPVDGASVSGFPQGRRSRQLQFRCGVLRAAGSFCVIAPVGSLFWLALQQMNCVQALQLPTCFFFTLKMACA